MHEVCVSIAKEPGNIAAAAILEERRTFDAFWNANHLRDLLDRPIAPFHAAPRLPLLRSTVERKSRCEQGTIGRDGQRA